MKKNLLNSLILVCCVLIVGISSALALNNLDSSYAFKHIVRFYDNGGKWLNITSTSNYQVIPYDDSLSLSDNRLKISKSGCTFGGWRRGSNSGEKVTKSSLDKSDNNASFYAIWENCLESYVVTFNLNGASGSIDKQTIYSGSTVSKPSNPTRAGYTFLYWSKSSSGSEYNFNAKVTGSFTLYAIWKKNEVQVPTNPSTPPVSPPVTPPVTPPSTVTKYTITFELNGGIGDISSQSVEKGGVVSIPKSPKKDKFEFNYWSIDKNCEKQYDFSSNVNSNMTLYACYLKKYSVTINKKGLPFVNNYIVTVQDGDNLNEFNKEDTIIVADTTSYSMLDSDSCFSALEGFYSEFDDSVVVNRCNNIGKNFDCSVNNDCYSNKYVILSKTLFEEISYLKEKDVIDLDYDTYKYNGLFRDSSCKKTYMYSNSVKSDLELYECFEIQNEKTTPDEKPKKKKGVSATTVLIIIAVLSVIGFVTFLFFKGKIANRVD